MEAGGQRHPPSPLPPERARTPGQVSCPHQGSSRDLSSTGQVAIPNTLPRRVSRPSYACTGLERPQVLQEVKATWILSRHVKVAR
jgi:hypothetical protein